MKNEFDQLMKYCFKELPPNEELEIDRHILRDDMAFAVVNGINRLRRRLGSKKAVQDYFEKSTASVRMKLFPEKR